MTEVLALISGKGGVGKTLLTAAIGLSMGRAGARVLLIDCDAGMNNLDIPLGLSPGAPDFSDLADGRCFPEEAVQHAGSGVDFLGAPTGADWRDLSKSAVMTVLEDMDGTYDYILLDCPAGMGKGLRFARRAASRMLIAAAPDPASLRAARRMAGWAEGRAAVVLNDFGRPGGDPVSFEEARVSLSLPWAGVVPHTEEAARLAAEGRLSAAADGVFWKAAGMVWKQWLTGAEYPLSLWETLLTRPVQKKEEGAVLLRRQRSALWKRRRR